MSAETAEHVLQISQSQYWLATGIFIASYVAIISEKINKTKVALMGAALMLITSVVTQLEAFHSPHLGIDYNVVFLLIFMMVIINITGKSGVFEWSAVKLAKLAKGSPTAILIFFIIFTAFASAFLDNVTTILLVAPVSLFVADELEIDPLPFLLSETFASNVGGTATLIGDPPNLIIGSKAGLGFNDFILNLGPAVLIMMVALVVILHLVFGKKMHVSAEKRKRIMDIKDDKLIKDLALVKKSVTVLALTILGFCFHGMFHLEPATIAFVGAAVLLLISKSDPHHALAEVEWPTIFFFIGLFILVGGVVKVGLIEDLSTFVIKVTGPTETNMFKTSMVMLWFSGILSAIVDNIPYVATMTPLVSDMANNVFHNGTMDSGNLAVETMHHAVLMPVWWALALGACLGGNATPIGASANVIALGIAEKAGKKISFIRFMCYGVPITIVTLAIGMAYIVVRYY